ncbi:MAG: hypothetical protein J0M08_02285 [Bacteroidetes bacterium]|nr:hypothetical protein [Bacteroidota bacterium]
MKSLYVYILIATGLLSCTSQTQQSDNKALDSLTTISADTIAKIDTSSFGYEDYGKLESYLAKNKINSSSLQVIDYDCAILIYPTENQIKEMEKENGEEAFYTIAEDSQFYQGNAIGIIDSLGIKTIKASGQFLRLKGDNETWDLDIRKKNLPAWNIIFFKSAKEPQIISAIDLTIEQTKHYFELK